MEKNEFDGVKLDNTQRKKLTKYLNSVLGVSFYSEIEKFFTSVWFFPAEYKVFLARRCLNLMHSFYRSKYDSPVLLSDKDFYSERALLANVPEIVGKYRKTGKLPKVLIVDDILIHGRNISILINKYVDALCSLLEKNGIDKTRFENEILDSIVVKTFVRSCYPLLIPNEYRRCLQYREDGQDIWQPVRWHELSSRISVIADRGFFSNTSFILSLYENIDGDFRYLFAEAARKEGFERFNSYDSKHTEACKNRYAWIKPIKNPQGDIIAAYTLRVIQSSCDGGFHIIPFVMMSDISKDMEEKPGADKIIPILDKYFGSSVPDSMIRTEALYMILSHNLLLLLSREAGLNNLKISNFDVDKIRLNFNVSNSENDCGDFVSEVASFNAPLLEWVQMDEFVQSCTEQSKPLMTVAEANGTMTYLDNGRTLDSLLSLEGEQREREAYLIYTRKRSFFSDNIDKPIAGLLHKLSQYSFTETLGYLLEFMDKGIAAVNTTENSEKYSCVFHAGEQSLFIRAKRLFLEMPVLVAIEKDCVQNEGYIKERLDLFYGNDPDLCSKTKEFVSRIYFTGQRIEDWDINFFKWMEAVDDDGGGLLIIEEKKRNEKLMSKMMVATEKRLCSMERYRKMFPKDE